MIVVWNTIMKYILFKKKKKSAEYIMSKEQGILYKLDLETWFILHTSQAYHSTQSSDTTHNDTWFINDPLLCISP